MLEIKNLHVKLAEEDKVILRGVDLTIGAGQVHAIMGPNGSGKSTLSYVLAGRDGYEVTDGSATLDGAELLEMEPEERAAAGLFLAFQYPVEIPGVGNMTFLRTAVNAQRKARGEDEVSAADFLKLVREKASLFISGRLTGFHSALKKCGFCSPMPECRAVWKHFCPSLCSGLCSGLRRPPQPPIRCCATLQSAPGGCRP